MAFFGLFGEKKVSQQEQTFREMKAYLFPGGDQHLNRDCRRITTLVNGKISADQLKAFVSAAKSSYYFQEDYSEENFIHEFIHQSENKLSPKDAFEIYVYFSGEGEKYDMFARDAAKKNVPMQPELLEYCNQLEGLYSTGTYVDLVPGGYGEFGYSLTNPIPTISVKGSNKYLAALRYEGRAVENKRVGSTSSPVTAGNVDIYELTAGGREVGSIYICPYHKRNCKVAPRGFTINFGALEELHVAPKLVEGWINFLSAEGEGKSRSLLDTECLTFQHTSDQNSESVELFALMPNIEDLNRLVIIDYGHWKAAQEQLRRFADSSEEDYSKQFEQICQQLTCDSKVRNYDFQIIRKGRNEL